MSSASTAASDPADLSPAQVLHALMVSNLYPLLQNARTGRLDPMVARNAAVELLKAFRIRDTAELFICTQIVTFGLAALDSLGLSMTEGLSPAMVLRCRASASGLQRTSQQGQRALEQHRAAVEARRAREAAQAQIPTLADAQAQAEAQIAHTERLLAEARARAGVRAGAASAHEPAITAAAASAREAAWPAPPAADPVPPGTPHPVLSAPLGASTAGSVPL